MAGRVGHACPPPPEETAQDAAFQRLQQGALPRRRVSEQLQLDPGLDGLCGTQLLDVAQLVVILTQKTTEEDENLLKNTLTDQVTLRYTFVPNTASFLRKCV